MKDIHFHLLMAVFLPWMSPIVLAGDWHGSPLMPGATNWQIMSVCFKSPAEHTCYMYVAKNCISAPLLYIVSAQQSVPLFTCVSTLQFLHAHNWTHTCKTTIVHAHLCTGKKNSPTYRHLNLEDDVIWNLPEDSQLECQLVHCMSISNPTWI